MKKLVINIDDNLYERLRSIQASYHFDSIDEVCKPLFTLLVRYVEAANKRQSCVKSNYADDIIEMFNEYGSWERTPDGIVPIRKNNKTID